MKRTLVILLYLILNSSLFGQIKELKLNHFYVVVDSVTFKSIKESKEFNSIINIDKGLPDFKAVDSTSTTVYLRGEKTYIEIMGPNNKFKEEVGSIGLGFSWDSQTSNDTIFESRIKPNRTLKFNTYNATWKFDSGKTPWYTAYYSDLNGHISTWYSFYHPAFLERLYNKDYSYFKREYYLAGAYDNQKIAKDISEIILDCSKEDYQKIIQELDCFYVRSKEIRGNTTIYSIDEIKLELNLKTLTRIKRFSLKTQKSSPRNDTLGNLKLSRSKKEVIFEFKGNKE